MSSYVKVSILDPEGDPRREYKVKGAGIFVEAVSGQRYGIRMKNKSTMKQLGCIVYVDGKNICRRSVKADETFDLTEVVSKVFTVGGVTKRVYQPLLFAFPEIKEGEEDLSDDVAERLGCIEIQVRELEECAPFPFITPVQTQESLKVAMTEEQATMKGAFRSVTTLGAAERIATMGKPVKSRFQLGKHLGKVKLRYGSRAMLLFKGVPAAEFMMSSNHKTTADDDSDEDEQSEGDSEPCTVGRKRGRASGAVSRPPPGPQLSRKALHKKLKSEH